MRYVCGFDPATVFVRFVLAKPFVVCSEVRLRALRVGGALRGLIRATVFVRFRVGRALRGSV